MSLARMAVRLRRAGVAPWWEKRRPGWHASMPWLFRSAGLRLAMIYAALFGMSALALVLFLWWETAGLLDRQVEAAIRAEK